MAPIFLVALSTTLLVVFEASLVFRCGRWHWTPERGKQVLTHGVLICNKSILPCVIQVDWICSDRKRRQLNYWSIYKGLKIQQFFMQFHRHDWRFTSQHSSNKFFVSIIKTIKNFLSEIFFIYQCSKNSKFINMSFDILKELVTL